VPKASLSINKFDLGIMNRYDKRDVPEGGMYSLTGVIPDIVGQLRQGGGETPHNPIGISDSITVNGLIEPGYGLFSFKLDYELTSDSESATKYIAIQNKNIIGIFESSSDTFVSAQISLSYGASSSYISIPIYHIIDGELKISDAKFNVDNSSGDSSSLDSKFVKTFRYIRKRWFPQISDISASGSTGFPESYNGSLEINNSDNATKGDFYDLASYIFPPTVAQATDTKTHCLYSHDDLSRDSNVQYPGAGAGADADAAAVNYIAQLEAGNIALAVTQGNSGNSDEGEWMQDSKLGFGVSFQYDNNQESQVTEFYDKFSCTLDNIPLAFQLFARQGPNAFDKRLSGINLYWTSDSSGGFDDPLWLGYWHWGLNESDLSYFETHEGLKTYEMGYSNTTPYVKGPEDTIAGMTGTQITYAGLRVDTLPTITFEIRNGFDNNSESICAKYKTSVVTGNRRVYIGGVKQYKFDPDRGLQSESVTGAIATPILNSGKQCKIIEMDQRLDRMIKSPVNKFDIFPEENFIDVAVNDGESITALVNFNDRILQFKENTLYIINISGDYEYLESQHKWMGINHSYQVLTTEYGVIWVNKRGCYIYTGEGNPVNLILNKLKNYDVLQSDVALNRFVSWETFIGSNGMIGYIKKNKQVVVFEDPSSSEGGDVMIYDMQTKSWSHMSNSISSFPKSNIVLDYDDSCLYMSNTQSDTTIAQSRVARHNVIGGTSVWELQNVNSLSASTSTKLRIGSEDITQTLSWSHSSNGEFTSDTSMSNLADYITAMINAGPYTANIYAESYGGNIKIYMPGHTYLSTLDGEDLSFSSAPTVSAYSWNTSQPAMTNFGQGQGLQFLDFSSYVNDLTMLTWLIKNDVNLLTENSTHYSMTMLCQHLQLNGLAVGVGDIASSNSDAYYNPYNFPYVSITSVWNSEVIQPTDVENTIGTNLNEYRQILNIDSSNLPYIQYTKSSGNYGWSTNNLKLEFGTSPGKIEGSLLNSKLQLYRFSSAAGQSSFYTGGGTTGTNITTIYYDDVSDSNNSTVFTPIVFRNFTNPESLHISIVGNHESIFSVGTKYHISGGSSGNSTSSGQSNYLRNVKLSEITVYTSSNNTQGYDSDNGQRDSFTVLVFNRGDQSDSGTDEPEASGKWAAIKSYGDTCATAITFSSDVSVVIDNTLKSEATESSPQVNSLHLNRSDYNAEERITVTLKDQNGVSVDQNYIPVNENEYRTMDNFISSFNNLSFLSNFILSNPLTHVITGGIGENNRITAAYLVSTTEMRVNADLNILGFSPGDTITFTHSTPSASDYFANYGAVFTDNSPLYKIKTMDAIHGATTAGYTHFTIQNSDAELELPLHYKTAITLSPTPSPSDSTNIASTGLLRLVSSAIAYTGPVVNPEVPGIPISSSISSGQQLSVNEFNNDVNNGLSNSTLHIETKDIDFGSPGTSKKIHYIDVSYSYSVSDQVQSGTSPVSIFGYLNNTNDPVLLTSVNLGSSNDIANSLSETDGSWRTSRMYFNTSKRPISAKSISIVIESDVAIKNFKLNDISISFRETKR
jgi:hypothetical protein